MNVSQIEQVKECQFCIVAKFLYLCAGYVLTVSGAGMVEANGTYHWNTVVNNAPVFEFAFDYSNTSPVIFRIKRMTLDAKRCRWRLIKFEITASTRKWIDVYGCVGLADEIAPAADAQWTMVKGMERANPAPKVTSN